MPIEDSTREMMAAVVGAEPVEVVVMNSLTVSFFNDSTHGAQLTRAPSSIPRSRSTLALLTSALLFVRAPQVNLHLGMAAFYKPTAERYKIMVEGGCFPSDEYAVQSQLRLHGHDPAGGLVHVQPREGERLLRTEDVVAQIAREGSSVALVLLAGVQYLTGQLLDIETITAAAHAQGCLVGWDLAHAVGNCPLQLHEWGPDFAAWCTYKYLNSGPGALGGFFVHSRHAGGLAGDSVASRGLNRLAGCAAPPPRPAPCTAGG